MNHTPSNEIEVPCPLCGSSEYHQYVMAPSHYGPTRHRVTQCDACGMIYTNPQSANYLHEVEHRGALERHFSPARIEGMYRHARFLLRLVSPFARGRSFLDFGCGAGGMVKTALDLGWSARGYDLNAGLVEHANAFWKFQALETGSLEAFYQRHKNSFDVIIAFQVFEHLQKPLAVGRELVELLRPGGVLMIDVPNVNQPMELLRKGRTLDPTSHWCHFSVKTLKSLMERIGCEPIYSNAAPSLVSRYASLGFKNLCIDFGLLTKKLMPPVGTGVCVIGRKS